MSAIRILVVDDDPAVRRLAAHTLTLEGFDVVQASSGKEALDHIDGAPIDLIVLDNSMPDMNGRDVARALREDPRNAGLPILMLSALVSDEQQWDGWRAGVDLYLTKPYENDDLVSHVHRLLRERGPRSTSR